MNQENLELAITPSAVEQGKVIPLRTGWYSGAESQTQPGSANTTYVAATDLRKWQAEQQPSRRISWGKSFGALTSPDRVILDSAFSRISQVLQREFQMAELSNCFDEWKDFLETASRKVEGFTGNHRKILGTLLSLIGGKDISDFDIETLRIFRDATNVLRMPRTSKQDARRIIVDLLKRKKKIMMPLGVDESAKNEVQALDNMIGQIILKSRTDR
jgi:hypothetical protein